MGFWSAYVAGHSAANVIIITKSFRVDAISSSQQGAIKVGQ